MTGYSSNAAHWALVPDEADASTWRLPLYRAGDTVPDPKLVAYAVGRLSPDAHPTIPVRHARDVRARVLAAWHACHDIGTSPPDALAKSIDGFAGTGKRGVMIALAPPVDVAARLALPDGLPGVVPELAEGLHVPLCYLGGVEAWPESSMHTVRAVVSGFVAGRWPLWGSTSGFAVFDVPPDELTPAVALVDVPGLAAFRTCLVDALLSAGLPVDGSHDFQPHMTLGYGPADLVRTVDVATYDLSFVDVLVVHGDRVDRFPLSDALPPVPLSDDGVGYVATTKSVEQRYTFAPVYVPGVADAHGEVVSAADLQVMGWEWMRTGDRTVRFWHVDDSVAGEVVEMVCWPYESTVELVEVDGTRRTVTLPAGTMYAGVVWEPWAWEDVKAGVLRAYSWGGFARRKQLVEG